MVGYVVVACASFEGGATAPAPKPDGGMRVGCVCGREMKARIVSGVDLRGMK